MPRNTETNSGPTIVVTDTFANNRDRKGSSVPKKYVGNGLHKTGAAPRIMENSIRNNIALSSAER